MGTTQREFIFEFYFMGNAQPIFGTVRVLAQNLCDASDKMTARGNALADFDKNGTGYRCVDK